MTSITNLKQESQHQFRHHVSFWIGELKETKQVSNQIWTKRIDQKNSDFFVEEDLKIKEAGENL